jgi:hypothetical protein
LVVRHPHLPRRPDPPHQPFLSHLPYLVLFGVLTVIWTRPLASIATSSIVGTPGDNLSFVWNFWWAKTALATGQRLFWTPALFAPIGTSLATHTYAPLVSIGAALLFPRVPPLELYNGALLLAVFLNFACAYAAASTVTHDHVASALAAIVFGGAPFFGVRLEGHLSVLNAWVLPLIFAVTIRWLRRQTLARTLAVPFALAAAAYTDYYYFVYALGMVALLAAFSTWDIRLVSRPLTPRRRRVARVLAALLTLAAIAIVAIAVTGGADTTLAGVRVRMTDTFNARVIAGFLLVAVLAVWKWPAARVSTISADPSSSAARWSAFALALSAGTLALLLIPLAIAAISLWRAGDYATQAYVWRNAPPGIDLASLVLGNQLSPLTGALTRAAYQRFGINAVESAAWLGVVPTVLVIAAWPLRTRRWVRAVFGIGVVFLIWALGPYLRVLNYNTGIMLPQTIARFVPILANARIPGRAFAVVQLAAALLGAAAVASWRGGRQPARAIVALVFAGLLVDYWPGSRVTTQMRVPAVYETLRTLPAGDVLELPFGIRDGFGEHGSLDHRSLFYQTVHGHDEMGGFVARLSPKTEASFEGDPVMGPILRLSEHADPGAAAPCRSSLVCSTKYVVIDERTASPELQAFVSGVFAMDPVASADGLTLYSVRHVPACACSSAPPAAE